MMWDEWRREGGMESCERRMEMFVNEFSPLFSFDIFPHSRSLKTLYPVRGLPHWMSLYSDPHTLSSSNIVCLTCEWEIHKYLWLRKHFPTEKWKAIKIDERLNTWVRERPGPDDVAAKSLSWNFISIRQFIDCCIYVWCVLSSFSQSSHGCSRCYWYWYDDDDVEDVNLLTRRE